MHFAIDAAAIAGLALATSRTDAPWLLLPLWFLTLGER